MQGSLFAAGKKHLQIVLAVLLFMATLWALDRGPTQAEVKQVNDRFGDDRI